MRSTRPSRHLACFTAAFLLGAALPLHADERVVYYSEPTETPGFFHRVSDFFRDLFATEQSLSPRPTPPRPTAPRYNLDLPPPGTGYGYGRRAGTVAVESTEQSDAIAAHNSAAAAKSKAAKHAAQNVTTSKEPPPSHKIAEETKPQPAPKPKHSSNPMPPEERPSASSSQVVASDTPKPVIVPKVPTNVPTGTRTSKSTRVKSPYPPYNELDVTGLSTGSLAMDPTTQKVFRVP